METVPNLVPLTQARLKEIVHYDPDTGHFTALINSGCALKVGERAGRKTTAGYRSLRLDKVTHLEHRVAVLYMTGSWPANDTDHENGIRSDNRYANLRACSNSENRQNMGVRLGSATGHTGVTLDKCSGKFRAQIKFMGATTHCGLFGSLQDAVNARGVVKRQLHKFQPVDPTRQSYTAMGVSA